MLSNQCDVFQKLQVQLTKAALLSVLQVLSHLTCSVEHLYGETECFEACMECLHLYMESRTP